MTNDDTVSKILDKLDDLSREVKVLRSDTTKTQSDVAMMNMRMRSVADGNKAVQTDVSDIKSDIRRLEVLHEETDSTIQQIADSVSPFIEQSTSLKETVETHEDQLTTHDRRLNLLEKHA